MSAFPFQKSVGFLALLSHLAFHLLRLFNLFHLDLIMTDSDIVFGDNIS